VSGSTPKRQLTLLDCFGIGVNGIIGSGIFLLPATLARRAGGASPLSWLVVGGLCTLVAITFAQASARTELSGGPYRYARDAFGPTAAFVVGWITLASSLLGFAAVARGFADHAAWLLRDLVAASLDARIAAPIVLVALVGGLAALNIVGVRPSARTGDAVGLLKIGALLIFAAIGLLVAHPRSLSSVAPAPRAGEATGVVAAAFSGLFACTGFEYVPVPAGETVDPRRSVGLAMVLSVVGATLLYAAIQAVYVTTAADPAGAATPLVDAARGLGGDGAARAMAALALVSAFGFCSGSALVGPRYLESFAEDGFVPSLLARRSARFGTPVAATIVLSILVLALAAALDFSSLADTSTVAVVAQYASTALAVLVGAVRARARPLSYVTPVAALLGVGLFTAQVARAELALSGAILAAGLAIGGTVTLARRLRHR
jgi:amino acid transporter